MQAGKNQEIEEEALSFIRPETRERCHIFQLDEKSSRKFINISAELFHFLYEAESIPFNLYFRIGSTMVEFIKKNESSKELLDQLWAALQSDRADIDICVLKSEKPLFDSLIESIRERKIEKLLEADPALDRKVLDVFSNLSDASQLVVRGGINDTVANRVKASAAFLVGNLMDNEIAIATLSRMITHDPTLYDHSASVAMLATMIGSNCLKKPLSAKENEVVAQCGLYHDVGKTCVPSHILNKPGSFTKEEYEVMKTHAELGEKELFRVMENGTPITEIAARVAGEHHERFNGQGYPRGRRGRFEENPKEGIHLFTRIVTIADVYSALLMKRVYKPAYEPQDAIKIMAKVAQEEYDPVIFKKFILSVVKSLNAHQEKVHGQEKGRLLDFDDSGKLVEVGNRKLAG